MDFGLLCLACVCTAVSMRVEDYFPQGKRWWLRLHEKGGKHHEMPVHHTLEEYLDRYIEAAGGRRRAQIPLISGRKWQDRGPLRAAA